MKIRFASIYKGMKKNTSFWWLMTPSIKKYWSGQIIHIGTRCMYMVLDFRGINNIQDFADALGRPKIWHILKRLKKK